MQDNAIIAKRKGTSKDGNPGGAFLYIENPWLDQGFDKALAMSL